MSVFDVQCNFKTTFFMKELLQVDTHLPVCTWDQHSHCEDSQKRTGCSGSDQHRGFYDTVQHADEEADSHDEQADNASKNLDAEELMGVFHRFEKRSDEILEGDGGQ